jgi:hypothetical protein
MIRSVVLVLAVIQSRSVSYWLPYYLWSETDFYRFSVRVLLTKKRSWSVQSSWVYCLRKRSDCLRVS